MSRRTVQADIEMMRSDKLGREAPVVVVNRKYYTYADKNNSIAHVPPSQQDLKVLTEVFGLLQQFNSFSHPCEDRSLVKPIVKELERQMGPHTYFYDNNYVSQLARLSLDTLLQAIYRGRSKLVVVFLLAHYQRKQWCGLNFGP